MKKFARFLGSAMAVLIATGAVVTAAPSKPIETPFAPKEDLRFAVMSDTHIGAAALANESPEMRLERAYKTFNAIDPNMDAVAVVGDLTDHGTQAELDKYKEIMTEFSTAEKNMLAMGNHDVTSNAQAGIDRFVNTLGPTFEDQVIGGYHFITMSPTDSVFNTTTFKQYETWLEERLAAANAEDPTKPIFIFTHQSTRDTHAGSNNCYMNMDYDFYEIYCKYPQVVTFSGHSHTSAIDPRTLWQGDFTAINDGSLYYAALEYTHPLTSGLVNNAASITPLDRGASSTAMVVDVDGSKVTVRRFDMYYGREVAAPYVFDTATPKEDRPYIEKNRIDESSAPAFASSAKVTISNVTDTGCTYTFPQAVNQSATIPDDGAFTYAVKFTDLATGEVADTARLTSDYFKLPMLPTVTFQTSKLQKNHSYSVSVTPMNFYGKEGEALVDTFLLAAPLNLSTDANLETGAAEDYFRVNAGLQSEAASNVATVTYTYDTQKFQYRGFEYAEGTTELANVATETGRKITIMFDGYNAKDLGEALFSGTGVALTTGANIMNVKAEYVVKASDGAKTVEIAAGNISFTSIGEGSLPGDFDGDGEITLIDLSNIIDFYGAKSGSEDWDKVQICDMDGDGEITIFDISSIAKQL